MPRILVAGAGAIGCTLAARLAAGGARVELLARGNTYAHLRQHPLVLDDLDGQWRVAVPVHTEVSACAPPNLLLLACKSQDLPTLAAQVAPCLTPHTLVIPLVNGVPFWYFHGSGGRFDGAVIESVDPGGQLQTLLPMERVLGAVVFITAEVVGPGSVQSRTPHLLMLGEPAGGLSERLQAVARLFADVGIEARPLAQIRDKLWTKLIANLTSNPMSVITGATLEQIYGDERLLLTVRKVMEEAALTASCHGARLEIDPIEFIALGTAMGPVRTSMLQDLERGRPLELAAIGDAVLELGAHYSLTMPATRALVAMAHWRAAGPRTGAVAQRAGAPDRPAMPNPLPENP